MLYKFRNRPWQHLQLHQKQLLQHCSYRHETWLEACTEICILANFSIDLSWCSSPLIISNVSNTHNEFLCLISITDQIKFVSVQVCKSDIIQSIFKAQNRSNLTHLNLNLWIIVSNHESLPLNCGNDDIFKPTKAVVVVQAIVGVLIYWRMLILIWFEDLILS